MQKFLFILACIPASTIAQDNSSNEQPLKPQAAIINGHDVPDGGRPFQIFMQAANHFCGGSIISSHYVLTAAHCTIGQNAADISIIAGTINRRQPYRTYRVSNVINHQNYQKNTHQNDISLLRTSTPMKFDSKIQPINLPRQSEQVAAGTRAVVSGWGSLKNTEGPVPNIMQEATITVFDFAYCQKALGNNAVFLSNICAGDQNQRRGQCSGDSGGPLTANGKQIGVVSWSVKDPDCGSTKKPGVYTKVSSFTDWILIHTQNLS